MPIKFSSPCARCGENVDGNWEIAEKWKRFQWSDTLPVKMRTLRKDCPFCGANLDVVQIVPVKPTDSLIKVRQREPKPKKLSQDNDQKK